MMSTSCLSPESWRAQNKIGVQDAPQHHRFRADEIRKLAVHLVKEPGLNSRSHHWLTFSLKSAMTGAKSTPVEANFSGRTPNIFVPQRRWSLKCFFVV